MILIPKAFVTIENTLAINPTEESLIKYFSEEGLDSIEAILEFYDNDWNEIRSGLDAPLLKDAYYEVGDKVLFVKKNTFNCDSNTLIPKDSLKRKGWFSYTIFDQQIEVVDIDNPIVNEIYYKNELSIAFVSSVKTSDDGSGDILYLLKGVIPKPPESNPSVLEKDIITINQDSLEFLGSFICKKYRDDNN